jgi:hypothetical protein
MWITLEALKRDKAPKLDGMVIEFFLWMWKVICKEYTKDDSTIKNQRWFSPKGCPKADYFISEKGWKEIVISVTYYTIKFDLQNLC